MDIAKGRTAVISTESTYEESSEEPKIPEWASYADKSIEDFFFSPSKTTIENPLVLSIFPGGAECSSGSMVDGEHLQWYGRWLDSKFEHSPHFTKRLRSFTSFFEIAALAKAECSIDKIATCLLALDLVEEEDEENRRQVARPLYLPYWAGKRCSIKRHLVHVHLSSLSSLMFWTGIPAKHS